MKSRIRSGSCQFHPERYEQRTAPWPLSRFVIIGRTVQLRVARADNGTGRVYTITGFVSDFAGNSETWLFPVESHFGDNVLLLWMYSDSGSHGLRLQLYTSPTAVVRNVRRLNLFGSPQEFVRLVATDLLRAGGDQEETTLREPLSARTSSTANRGGSSHTIRSFNPLGVQRTSLHCTVPCRNMRSLHTWSRNGEHRSVT